MTTFVPLNVSPEARVEAVPGLLHDLFDRLSQQEIIPFKPDYCVIDFFSEVIFFHNCLSLKSALGMIECFFFQGDYTHPHHSPPWYGRPVCTLCLTDCDMVFGRAISGERGDYRGPLKLTLSTG